MSKNNLGVVIHVCNLNFQEGKSRRLEVQAQLDQKAQDPI
jgi:hypothetical protein